MTGDLSASELWERLVAKYLTSQFAKRLSVYGSKQAAVSTKPILACLQSNPVFALSIPNSRLQMHMILSRNTVIESKMSFFVRNRIASFFMQLAALLTNENCQLLALSMLVKLDFGRGNIGTRSSYRSQAVLWEDLIILAKSTV